MAQLKDLIVNGPSRFIGDVYATTFTGNLAGNANTATSATNAGMIAGLSVHSGRNNEANKIVRTDQNGYLQVGYINSSSGHEKNASNPTYVWGSNSSDSYLRSYQTSSLSVNYATSSGSCSGNAATATKAGCLDTGGMVLYANHNNEINFGGTTASSIIFFGYRAAESKPIPTSFVFGGSNGTASLTASGFKKNGSGASYVLTGDGGHAAISGLSVNYANSSGSCSGNAATATNASSAGNADKLDGYHLSQIIPVVTKRDFTNGTLVKTNISFPGTNRTVSEAFLLTVRGNGYGRGIINFEFQGYVYYAKSYAHPQIVNSDFIIYSPKSIDKIYTMSIDNKLCFWWARQEYWQGFHIFCTTNTESYQNRVTEVQDISKPSGLFEQIYTPKLSLTTSNYTSYTVTKTGSGASGTWDISITGNAATATNADTLDGYHATMGSNQPWGTIPVITPQGWMDVGKQFEFHYDNTTGSDYSTVLACTGNYSNIVNLPSKSGTLALLTDNVASASKWATARTITLTGSVTGSVSIDGSQNVTLATTTNHTHNYLPLSGGTMSNTNKVTNLNADLLDGYHASSFSLTSHAHSYIFTQGDHRSTATKPNDYNNIITFAGLKNNATVGKPSSTTYNYIVGLRGWSDSSGGKAHELAFNDNGIFHRIGATDTWEAWTMMLTTSNFNSYAPKLDGTGAKGTWGINISGNAATATKLATSRTIWGHNFDGTGNVKGALSGVTTINSTLYFDSSGNVGIGTASPSYKLYVNGDGYFVDNVITESDFSSRGDAIIDGTVSCYKLSQASDIKYKTNIKQIEYEEALKIIENLNPVTWDWNENTIVTGSSSGFVAQEAEEFIPNAISRDNKNNLSLDYTQLHSYEIKVIQEQQKEIIKLKEKLKILEKLIS